MSRLTKFDMMRRRRELQERRDAKTRREALEHHWLQLDDALPRAFERHPQDSKQLAAELREIDIDAVHANRKQSRRWWWPLQRVAAALRPHHNLER